MRVLVTGATGFIGTRLRRELVEAGHEVVAVTRSTPPVEPPDSRCRWIRLDLEQAAVPRRALGVEAVVYLAQSRHYRDFPERAREIFAVNATSLLAWLNWARDEGVGDFVYTSSANVYQPSRFALKESAPVAPDSFYARSKFVGEQLVESFAPFLACTTFRLFTVYGEGQSNMLIATLINRIRAGEPVQVQGSGGLCLSPIHVSDAALFLRRALEHDRPRTTPLFNLCGPEGLTLRQMAVQIGEAVGRPPVFEQREGPEPAGWIGDSAAVAVEFGSAPALRFADGIRRTVEVDRP